MGRIIAIDYGKKRTGLAVTDPLQIIATALDVVETGKLLAYLKSYFSKEQVDATFAQIKKNGDYPLIVRYRVVDSPKHVVLAI